MLVSNYLKRNYVKEHNLCFRYLRFIFDTILKLFFFQIHTISMLVN